MTLSLVKADEGWKRLMDFNTAQEHRSAQWARSSNHAGGNRVPFAPEDIAMPPPWLLPNQQPQVAFPVAQAQVRSFFDEEVVEWPPRSAKKSSQTQYVPEPSQHPQPPPQIIHTTLQPPRRQWTETSIRPVQHIRFEADRQSTSQRPQAEKKAAPAVKQRDPAAVTQHVVDLKKIPPPVVAVDLKEPYRAVGEPKPEPHQRQNKQQQTASRKSAISYDSSEYDYEEDATAVAAGHQDKQIIHSKMDESEGDQSFYDESSSLTAVDATMSVGGGQDDFYAKAAPPPQRRQQFVQQFHQPESRRQPQVASTEETDVEQHQAFDYGKTIFRTQVGSGQASRQHPHTVEYEQVQQRENGRPSTYVDETAETQRHQPAKAKQGQPGVRKQQLAGHRQQQQPLERNTSPTEAPVFEAERPSFFSTNLQASPNQRQFQVGQQHHQRQQLAPQQQAGEWPARHPAPESNRKTKPRTPYRPEEQQSSEKFVNVPKYKPGSNPAVAPVQRYQEEPEEFQRDHQSDPYHHQQQPYRPEEDGTNYGQPEEHHRPEENHRPEEHYRPKDHHRPKEQHHQPIYDNQEVQHGKKNHVRQRRPPIESRPAPESEPTQSNPWQTQQSQAEANAYDPYEEQRQEPHREQHHESEQQHEQHQPQAHQPEEPPSVAPIPGRRPPGGRPSFQSEEQFNGSDNDGKGNSDTDFEDSPPFVAPAHKRPQHPSANRPRPHRPLPPPQRPRDASIVTQGLNTLKSLVGLQSTQQRLRPHHSDARRPERHRQRPGGRRPPHHPAGNSFDNGGEIGRVDQLDVGVDEFDATDLSNAPVQARHNVQPIKEEPMEHRSDPDDEIHDFLPPVMSSTESSVRITAPPARVTEAPELPVPVSSTATPEEPKSTLFPPFNKRVRPQPPSPAQTESKTNAGKDSSAGQLRITSYKQRIEAMKERAKLREQLAQSKKDSESTADILAEPVVPVSVASTSTTTARPSTTRAKIPPRMPVRRPVTASPSTSTSSTTESVPVSVEKSQDTKESSYEQYKRRFKPKASSNRPVKEEEPAAPPAEVAPADVQEEEPSGRKNLFGKMPGSPFVRRRMQQKQQREEEERLLAEESPKPVVKEEVVEMPSVPPRPNKRIRPGQFARTTTVAPIIEPSLDDDEESGSVLASPDQWPPTSGPQISIKTETSSMPKAEEEEESAKIELVSVASVEADKDIENPKAQPIEEEQDYPTHQQQSYAFESAGQPFLDKPDLSSERVDSNVEEKEDKEPVPVQEKPRHSFFTMATNDPILPIEELLNIRVRDNGKDM